MSPERETTPSLLGAEHKLKKRIKSNKSLSNKIYESWEYTADYVWNMPLDNEYDNMINRIGMSLCF